MITERLTFQAAYGKGDELVALMKESFRVMPMDSVMASRLYTDLTGKMFTCAVEIDYADLATYAASTAGDANSYGSTEFQEWFAKMVACTELGERQLFNSEALS